jgi:hypothetical protein
MKPSFLMGLVTLTLLALLCTVTLQTPVLPSAVLVYWNTHFIGISRVTPAKRTAQRSKITICNLEGAFWVHCCSYFASSYSSSTLVIARICLLEEPEVV